MDESAILMVMDEAIDVQVVERAAHGSPEECRESLTFVNKIKLSRNRIVVIRGVEDRKLSAVRHHRPKIVIVLLEFRKEVLEIADRTDGEADTLKTQH
jgi:mRNA-degrading endonuclease HigB of HigAB toxin-antitoxin module